MASSDWTDCANSISGNLVKGVTAGVTKPNGGGTFAYGMRSTAIVNGAVVRVANQTNFAPTPTGKGGSIRGAIQRGVSAGSTGFQPFLVIGAQDDDTVASAYMLGLTDGDASQLALVKGAMVNGIPAVAPGTQGVLKRSTQSFPIGTWLHLRLDQRVNANGDVVLTCFQSDLGSNLVTAPVWTAVPGLDQLIDDALGANTGSAPFTQGYLGHGARFSDVGRRVYFDQLEVIRET